MGTSFTSDVRLKLSQTYTSDVDIADPSVAIAQQYLLTKVNGSSTDQSNLFWYDTRTVNAGANDDIDLAGVLTDVYGNTVTFATVKGIVIVNANTTDGDDLTIGNAGTNPCKLWFGATTHTMTVLAGETFYKESRYTGWTVTGGSADTLRIGGDAANNVTYTIYIWGVSA